MSTRTPGWAAVAIAAAVLVWTAGGARGLGLILGESKEQLSGYFVLECPDLDEALAWAARIPGARRGAIEVRPLLRDHE